MKFDARWIITGIIVVIVLVALAFVWHQVNSGWAVSCPYSQGCNW